MMSTLTNRSRWWVKLVRRLNNNDCYTFSITQISDSTPAQKPYIYFKICLMSERLYVCFLPFCSLTYFASTPQGKAVLCHWPLGHVLKAPSRFFDYKNTEGHLLSLIFHFLWEGLNGTHRNGRCANRPPFSVS